MPDSLIEWAEQNLVNLRQASNGEFLAQCPFCGVDENQFSINLAAGGGYSCLRALNCGNRGPDPAWMISKFEGISIHKAREKYPFLQSLSKKKANVIRSALKMRRKEFNETKMILEEFPPGFQKCYDESRDKERRWLIPKYLKHTRGVPKNIIKRFEIGYCVGLTKYANHIILPCYYKNNDGDMIGGFIGRNIKPKSKDDRYNNHFGPWVQHMLYGYKECLEDKARHIIICEGPFDALRLWQYGYNAMALMGVALKKGQEDLIRKSFPGSCRFTILLDEDASEESQAIAAKLYGKYPSIYIAYLKDGKDPGESSEEEIFDAIINANKA